ncbi:ribonuclease P protein subunit [Candidatus Woesearchaeota archaeon]|nr:ribonuclease P protein subunit [Candidatus Woesearchaeota archaeon]
MYPKGLIGKQITVVDAKNETMVGMHGLVVDETKATLTVLIDGGEQKQLLKHAITFRVDGEGNTIVGTTIQRRPEERLKG